MVPLGATVCLCGGGLPPWRGVATDRRHRFSKHHAQAVPERRSEIDLHRALGATKDHIGIHYSRVLPSLQREGAGRMDDILDTPATPADSSKTGVNGTSGPSSAQKWGRLGSQKVEPTVRFELTASCLQNSCSTTELRRRTCPSIGMLGRVVTLSGKREAPLPSDLVQHDRPGNRGVERVDPSSHGNRDQQVATLSGELP